MSLALFVPGIPRPQGSMRAMTVGGRARMFHADHDDLAVWRSAITKAAADSWDGLPLDEPTYIHLGFYLPRPPSIPKRRHLPDRRPDLDKLARAVLDSLTGIAFTDDARVVSLWARKFYAGDHPAGVAIACGPVDPGPNIRTARTTSVDLGERGASRGEPSCAVGTHGAGVTPTDGAS